MKPEAEFLAAVIELRLADDDLGAYITNLFRVSDARSALVKQGFTREELRDTCELAAGIAGYLRDVRSARRR